MRTLNYILLSVADIARSEAFYTKLLDLKPVQHSQTFVLYMLANGMRLGLWLDTEMVPAPRAPGGVEVTFSEDSDDAVNATHAEWAGKGARILQAPTKMGFGYTFTAEDPDGHRLRVFASAPR